MADTKISAAADIATLVGTDMLPVARSGSSTAYHSTMAEIATWANTQLPVASTSVAGVVKVDGTSVTIASGVISSAAAPPASTAPPLMDGTATAGTTSSWSKGDHIHPSDTSRVKLGGDTMTGALALAIGSTAPTPTTGDSSTKLATTAFVQAQMVASGAGVSTWNTRAGAVVLQQGDITAVGALHDVGRNLLHNPLFNVAQRGTGPFTTNNIYTLDRWLMNAALDTVSITRAPVSDGDRSVIGDEAAIYALQNTFTGNAGASACTFIEHRIEGVRRLSGKTVVLSFWANANASLKFGSNIIQIFGTGGSPSAPVVAQATGNVVTVSGTWARYSGTFTIPSTIGKTLGTNGDDASYLRLYYSSGSTTNAQSGNVGVQSGTINIWGIQLEIGSVATPLEKPDPQQDLANCQRFYQTGQIISAANVAAGGAFYASTMLPVLMRTAPTVATNGNSSVNVGTISWLNIVGGVAATTTGTAAGAVSINVTFTASADL